MKVEEAATANTGVWITFLGVFALYIGRRGDADPGAAADEPPLPGATTTATTATCRTGRDPDADAVDRSGRSR